MSFFRKSASRRQKRTPKPRRQTEIIFPEWSTDIASNGHCNILLKSRDDSKWYRLTTPMYTELQHFMNDEDRDAITGLVETCQDRRVRNAARREASLARIRAAELKREGKAGPPGSPEPPDPGSPDWAGGWGGGSGLNHSALGLSSADEKKQPNKPKKAKPKSANKKLMSSYKKKSGNKFTKKKSTKKKGKKK